MSNIKLRNTYKSYTAIFVIGILVGCICRLLDYFPQIHYGVFHHLKHCLVFGLLPILSSLC